MKNTNIIIGVGILIIVLLIAVSMMGRNTVPNENKQATTTPTVEVKKDVKKTTATTKKTNPVSSTKTAEPETITVPAPDPYTITYTNNGFSPKELKVPKGQALKFVNQSNSSLQVRFEGTIDSKLSEMNQSKSVGKGGIYEFNSVYIGAWSYYNAFENSHTANIVVY